MEVDEVISESDSGDSAEEGFSDNDSDEFILPTSLRLLQDDLLDESLATLDLDAKDIFASSPLSSPSKPTIAKQSESRGRRVSPFVAGLIGQANMAYVRRDFDETLRLCKEAIRNDPKTPEPYLTMSDVYEELGEYENALQFGMLAAANSQKDAETWIALAEKALDLDRQREALHCYSKAALCNRSLYEVFLNIIKLLDPQKEQKTIIAQYWRLVRYAPVELGVKILEFAQAGAQICLEDNDPKKALGLMEEAFKKVPEYVSLDDVNLIVELHIQLANYRQVLEIIAQYCDVYIEGEEDTLAEEGTDTLTTVFRVNDCAIKGEIPLQIRAKLAIAIIHFKAFHLTEQLISPFYEEVEEYGDVMIEIAEAFMAVDRHIDALKVLKALTNSVSFSEAQVWFHYAECLRILDRKEEAVSAFLVVMEKAPAHSEARILASELLNDLGRSDEAINALTQDPSTGFLDVGMLFEKCCLLRDSPDKITEFLAVGRLLLSRHCARFRTRAEYLTFMKNWKGRNREGYRKYQEEQEPKYIVGGKKMPTAAEEFDIFLALCQAAFESKQYPLLQRLTSAALTSKLLCRAAENEAKICKLAALGIYFNNDHFTAQIFYRNIIFNGVNTQRIWNTFNVLANDLEVLEVPRWVKFIARLLEKKPDHFAYAIIYANNCFSTGSYKQALSEYLLQFKHQPSALLALQISITFMYLALRRISNHMSVVVPQAIGYLAQYKVLRGEECLQEVHYNMGRMHHQLGMFPTAIFHYKQVFEVPAPHPDFDLKREAAYNLSRIYMSAKSYDLARYYVEKYIVI